MDQNSTMNKILQLLRTLLQTPDGLALYLRIEEGFKVCEGYTGVESVLMAYLDAQLQTYLDSQDADPATRMVIKLIQRRLAPYFEKGFKEDGGASIVPESELGVRKASGRDSVQSQVLGALKREVMSSKPSVESNSSNIPQTDTRFNLTRKRKELEQLQDVLEGKISKTISRNVDFLSNLKTVRIALQEACDEDTIDNLKNVLLEGIDEIIIWQQDLCEQFQSNSLSLKTIREDNIRLHEEIIKVRQLTRIDEFTGLPNRVAFMNQLEAEVGRAQRHNHPLAVCIIAVDSFDEALRREGQDVADEILRKYSDEVVARFRKYDMVARVGDKEFAILLPSTDVDGAIRALAEAQHRARSHRYELLGQEAMLPTFSCGLAALRQGEKAEALMSRAENALRQALIGGQKMLEVADLEDKAGQSSNPNRLH